MEPTASVLVPTIAGVVVLVAVLVDIAMTTLHPARRGRVSAAARRLSWRLLAHLARRGPRSWRGFAGPVAVAANLGGWIGGLWVGFALVYLPHVEDLAYTPSVPFGEVGPADALYLSGVALTTVGFGDVVAPTDALRLVTTFESACGFGVFTASISYVLSLYPMLNQIRTAAESASQLELRSMHAAASTLASDPGLQHAVALHGDIVSAHHAVRRFPVLLYFVPADEDESIAALAHAGTTVSAVLRWGIDAERVQRADAVGRALEAAVSTLIDDYEHAFGTFGRGHGDDHDEPVSEELARLRREVARAAPSVAVSPGAPSDGFPGAVPRAHTFVSALASAYGYEPARQRLR